MQAVSIVDDNRLDAELLARVIESIGREARVFHDEKPISDGTFSNRDGTIVLDFSLPESDAFQNLRQLARIGFSGRVVLITGAAFEYLAAARKYGCDLGLDVAVETKPIDIDRMVTLLGDAETAS